VIDRPHPADAMLGFDWERETSARALKFLKAKDNPFWKPYSGLKQRIPEAISKRLPEWREPKAARSAAIHFLVWRAWHDRTSFVPALTQMAKNDGSPQNRALAVFTLSHIATVSEEVLALMLDASRGRTNAQLRLDALNWFGSTKAYPEIVVPVLMEGLQDPG